MNKLLAISIACASIAIGAIPAVAEVDLTIHKLCIEAKDYEGCVNSMERRIKSRSKSEFNSHNSDYPKPRKWVEMYRHPDFYVGLPRFDNRHGRAGYVDMNSIKKKGNVITYDYTAANLDRDGNVMYPELRNKHNFEKIINCVDRTFFKESTNEWLAVVNDIEVELNFLCR